MSYPNLRTERHRFRSSALARAAIWFALAGLAGSLAACGGSSKPTTSTGSADYGTLVGAGVTLLRQGNPGAAEQLFRQAIPKRPRNPVGYYDLGVAYERAGDARDAVIEYEHALRVDARYAPALFNQAVIIAPRNPPTAMFLYRRVIHLQPDSATAYLNLGLLEIGTRALHRRGVRDLTRAVHLDPALRSRVPASLRAQLG